MDLKKIKEDLKELKKTVHLIDTLIRTRDEYLYRIQRLSASRTSGAESEIAYLNDVIEQMRLDEHMKRAIELQGIYTEAISTLGVTDKTILIEYYINGKPAWKIANMLCYSEDGIRKRLAKALKSLCSYMSNK